MSNKHNPTYTTLPEHHNGEDLPGGGGNRAYKGSVLNLIILPHHILNPSCPTNIILLRQHYQNTIMTHHGTTFACWTIYLVKFRKA
jgi:hypothetical protein